MGYFGGCCRDSKINKIRQILFFHYKKISLLLDIEHDPLVWPLEAGAIVPFKIEYSIHDLSGGHKMEVQHSLFL